MTLEIREGDRKSAFEAALNAYGAALAGHAGFNGKLRAIGRIADRKRLINVFRIGRSSTRHAPRHFRLPVDQLIV